MRLGVEKKNLVEGATVPITYQRLGTSGRFLVRLSDSLFLAPQTERFRKKSKTPFERASQEAPKPGVFLVHRRIGGFFGARTPDWPVWPQNGKNGAHEAHT
jgi:hypothetical protein